MAFIVLIIVAIIIFHIGLNDIMDEIDNFLQNVKKKLSGRG